ncbi:MAG: TIGR00730 family Rossman fold protein [Paludibacter sp.]|nr:TIGR00730 family Rossman fold protein [Paludibacter sp.]
MKIAVYCSSSNHIAESYQLSAKHLGEWIAGSGNVLVFGGATGGLMTAVSKGAASKNGKIIGIIPDAVVKMNRQSPDCTELIVVETMNERKAKMKEIADVFIVLPGSYGTLDELFDVVAAGIVGEHKKTVFVVNEHGFYNPLLEQIDLMRQEKFIPVENYKPVITKSVDDCVEKIKSLF